MGFRRASLICIGIAALAAGCGKNGGCEGPALPLDRIDSLRRSLQASSGPRGALVVPNPIDASRSAQATADSRTLQSFGSFLGLPDLLNPNRLENEFLKIRISTPNDNVSTLARPNSRGEYVFEMLDDHYGETMAYFAIQNMIRYVQALGFPVVKTRPLFVMVKAQSDDPKEVNAFYDHRYFDPNSPRLLRVFGDTQFPLRADRDIFWHEFGHHFNEAVSREIGIDLATDAGAASTEGAGLHECWADLLAMSVGNNPYIGRWTARNFNGYRPGEPLRSAVDGAGGPRMSFPQIVRADGRGNSPERYALAEWCTRVLWEVRSAMVREDSRAGSLKFERLLFSSLGLLKRDASVAQFHDALLRADKELHCGGHEDTIKSAFSSRGFVRDAPGLPRPLDADARAVGFLDGRSSGLVPGAEIVFDFRVMNNTGVRARNVRLYLEPVDQGITAIVYMQALGDLDPGQVIGIGQGGGLDYGWSPSGVLDSRSGSGRKIRYRLHVVPENGPRTTLAREITL